MGCSNSNTNFENIPKNDISNNHNHRKSNEVKIEPKASIKGAYPKGKSYSVQKIQGRTLGINDKLHYEVDLHIQVLSIPEEQYSLEVNIQDNKKLYSIGSFPNKYAENGQIMYNEYIRMNYYFERDQSLAIILKSNQNKYSITQKMGKLAANMKNGLNVETDEGIKLFLKLIPLNRNKKVFNFEIEVMDSKKEVFYIIRNLYLNDKWRRVYKSEERLNSVYDTVNIREEDLFFGNKDRNFKIELYSNTNVPFVSKEINMDSILGENTNVYNLGEVVLKLKVTQNDQVDFISLLQKGLHLSLMIGIDFTASNGDPSKSDSLHYISKTPNQYERAICLCGDIISHYDTDKMYPVFGFGGMPKMSNKTEHVFPLNFSNDPCVYGVEGIINTYKASISQVELSGPTYFAPILQGLNNLAKQAPEGIYFVIMIFTDGIICDIEDTKDQIVESCLLPISIIIVGVGNSDFSLMEELDGDDIPIKDSKGNIVSRDIVQFVPFLKYRKDEALYNQEVLKELPGQIEAYYMNKNHQL